MIQGNAQVVTAADRDTLFAWWTDFTEDDHAHVAFTRYGRVRRRVIWREPGKGAEYLDEGRALGFEVKARTIVELVGRDRVSARSESNLGSLDSEYWFEALTGGGTRVTARATYHEPPKARILAPITDAVLSTLIGYDLRAHVREFEHAALGV